MDDFLWSSTWSAPEICRESTNKQWVFCVQYHCNPNYPLLGVESHHKQHEEYKNLHGLVLSHNLAFSDGCWPREIQVSAPLYVTLVPEVVFNGRREELLLLLQQHQTVCIMSSQVKFECCTYIHSEIISLLHHVNMRILCCKCKNSTRLHPSKQGQV